MQMEQATVELVEGYGIVLTKKQLEAADSCGSSPTRLIRNLMATFFSPEVLAQSTACGSRGGRLALDRDILDACIRKLIITRDMHACIRCFNVQVTSSSSIHTLQKRCLLMLSTTSAPTIGVNQNK